MNRSELFNLELIRDEQKYLVEILKISAKYAPSHTLMSIDLDVAQKILERLQSMINEQELDNQEIA